jgi:hypothetical protein
MQSFTEGNKGNKAVKEAGYAPFAAEHTQQIVTHFLI